MKKLLLLAIIVFGAVAFTVSAQSTQPTAVLQYFDDPTQITVTDASGNQLTSVYYGMDLPPGSTVKTGTSTAEIQLDPNGSILKLADNTNFTIQTLQGNANQNVNAFSLLAGRLRTIAAKSQAGGDNYSIQTPTAVCGVRGTDFTLDVVPGKTDAVGVINGVVNFVDTATGKSIDVTAGNYANTFAQAFEPVKMTADQVKQLFDQMNFEKLNPTSVPGHAADEAAVQKQTTEAPPAVQPPAEQQKPAEQAAAKKPGPLDPLLNYLRDNLGMQIGTITIDGITYSKAVLQPQFNIGKLKMALYLPVIYQNDLFNPSTWYHPAGNNEWNFGTGPAADFPTTLSRVEDAGKDLMLKIRYIEWGRQRDPFFFKIGNLNDMTIGHGLLMYNYANDEDFPAIRRIGFNLGIDFKRFGFESVVNDLSNPQIFGGRLYVRPFGKGFLKPALGFSGIADISPASDLASTGATNLYGNPVFIALGPDLDLPVIDTDKLSLIAFADLGGMMPYYRDSVTNGTITVPVGLYTKALFDNTSGTLQLRNYGFASGLLGNMFGLKWRLEYRNFDGIFRPAMFNNTYDRTRTQYVIDMYNYVLDPTAPQYQKSVMGIYGQAGMSIGKVASFDAGYFFPWSSALGPAAMDNDYLHMKLSLNRGIIPKFDISGSISYDRTNFYNTLKDVVQGTAPAGVGLFDANTTMKAEVNYPVAPTLDLAFIYTTAVVHNPDGSVRLNPNNLPDVKGSISIETRVHF